MNGEDTTLMMASDGHDIVAEYVETQKLLRFTGPGSWFPVEIDLIELCERLGIEPARVVRFPLYILFAGPDRRAESAARHVVGVFDTKDEARAAFANVRLSRRLPSDWAELVSVDETNRVRVRAWFGERNGVVPSPPASRQGRTIFQRHVADDCGEATSPLIMRRSKWPWRAVVGVVLVTGALILYFTRSSTPPPSLEAGIRQPGVALVGQTVERVERVVYEPGTVRVSQTANELYTVMVLSGTLSVHGTDCETRSYGPGDSYVAGWEPHVTTNRGATPVEAVISYMTPRPWDTEAPAPPQGQQACAS